MRHVRAGASARRHLREIRAYTLERWGPSQADAYLRLISARFDEIASGRARSRPIPATYGVDGFFCLCGSHVIYWRRLGDGAVGVAAVLHERMDQVANLRAIADLTR